jgi:CRP-like cAMP-binding protein
MSEISAQILEILPGCPLFKGLEVETIGEILSRVTCHLKHFDRQHIIAHAGEEVFFQHIIVKGSVKGEMMDYAGKVIKIEDIFPPRPLAAAFLFGKQNRYPVNIVANEMVEIISIPKDAFLTMMQENQLILRNFVNTISSRGQFLSSKIKFLSFTTIKGKLAQYLLDLHQKANSDRIIMPLSQAQLSELFGVARPSVGRAISELNRDKIILTEGKQVKLLDLARLSALLK